MSKHKVALYRSLGTLPKIVGRSAYRMHVIYADGFQHWSNQTALQLERMQQLQSLLEGFAKSNQTFGITVTRDFDGNWIDWALQPKLIPFAQFDTLTTALAKELASVLLPCRYPPNIAWDDSKVTHVGTWQWSQYRVHPLVREMREAVAETEGTIDGPIKDEDLLHRDEAQR